MTTLTCYNRGCGLTYLESENAEEVCRHHPGRPLFHDGYKSWSCCKNKSIDFTTFLDIPGCTVSRHSNVKPEEPKKPVNTSNPDEVIQVEPLPKPLKVAERPPDDVPLVQLRTIVSSSLKTELARIQQVSSAEEMEDSDMPKPGTVCKNNGCSQVYEGEWSNDEDCLYHAGGPVFHEGLKYWSCCQRKQTDFNEFLRQEGCTTGVHIWIKKDSQKALPCRFDWHQTPSHIYVNVYSKTTLPEGTCLEASPTKLRMHITYGSARTVFDMEISLHGVVVPEQSSVELMGTKVEVKLRKTDPESWPKLQLL